ncbi:unnamed protein product [Caenorhabditis bovis]|uniref:Uncharacterized protein n=1 Tax=Caenorhabditis bovis TaxID=2654633 RepID=A0A8S1EG56_9PELO|nr:unnamed protein product [Caenorhabditis bovis]
MKIEKLSCSICGEVGNGVHFGAEACRACAAFFRRSVALNKQYKCRGNGKCEVVSTIRCICRSCRFAKCLLKGMKKEAVQKYRDSYGKRGSDLESPSSSIDVRVSSCPSSSSIFSSVEQPPGMPILNKLSQNYVHLENVRKVIHCNKGNVFEAKQPKAVSYKEGNQIGIKECEIVADWVVSSFPGFSNLPTDQKTILFRNCFLAFFMLQSGYYGYLHNRSDIIILPSGDFIDCEHPETFYFDPEGKQLMTSEDAVRMFASSFSNYRRNVIEPMIRDKVDNIEFFALCALVLFDTGLDGQSDECIALSRKTREDVQRELLYYYRNYRVVDDPSMRIANLLSLLPAVQRAVRRFQEDVEISHVFNVYRVDEKFYEISKKEMTIEKNLCSVCGEDGNGVHFGAETCRACAAFFRRSVALNKQYKCRGSGNCEVLSTVRCVCRSCRLAKCFAVGMKREGVQRHRDVYGKRNTDLESPNTSSAESTFPARRDDSCGMPILLTLSKNYTHLESVRKVVHKKGLNLFETNHPKIVSYREASHAGIKECEIVADWVVTSFPVFAKLPTDQKTILFRNSFSSFLILQGGYNGVVHNRSDVVIMPSGDFIDIEHLETFYCDIRSKRLMTTEDAVRLFSHSFIHFRKNVIDTMIRDQVDSYEFFFLFTLILFDTGIDKQTDECTASCRQMRDLIQRELLYYYRNIKMIDDPALRVANLLSLLPAVQRVVRRFQEDLEINQIFNLCAVDEKFYAICNGRF